MITVWINNQFMNNWIKLETLRIHDSLGPTADRCEMEVLYRAGSVMPEVGNIIEVFQDATKLFGGIITSIDATWVTGSYIRLMLQARDATLLMERKYISKTYTHLNGGALVRAILSDYVPQIVPHSSEFEEGSNIEIEPKTFDWVTVADAVDEIADITNRFWWVDPERKLHFVSHLSLPAPISLVDGVSNRNDIHDFSWSWSLDDTRNVVVFRDFGVQLPGNITTVVTKTGIEMRERPIIELSHEPFSLEDITVDVETAPGSNAYQRMVNRIDILEGNMEPEGSDGQLVQDEEGYSDDVFISFENKHIRFPRYRNKTPKIGDFGSGRKVKIVMKALAISDFADVHRDVESIAELQRREAPWGGSGEYWHVTSMKDVIVTNLWQMLSEQARRFFALYGKPVVTCRFKTLVPGWRAGQTISLKDSRLGLVGSGNRHLSCYVTDVIMTLIDANTIMYEVTISTRPKAI